MPDDEGHPLIKFAARYSDPTFNYLTAYVALTRADELISDLRRLVLLMEKETPEEDRWDPWYRMEALSYYAVGFCTCMEWHAKSRLVDLLTFKPGSIKQSDVQRTMTDKLVVQMVAQNATVVQLVGAALKVSSFKTYLSTMERIFTDLGFPWSPSEWLLGEHAAANTCWLNKGDFSDLEAIFEFRHSLVHEIDVGVVGHWNVRSTWSPEEAANAGRKVSNLLAGVEAAFTRYAPPLFPHLLTEERYPVGEMQALEARLASLTTSLDAIVLASAFAEEGSGQQWKSARDAFTAYRELEDEFIDKSEVFYWRYYDIRTPLRITTLRQRIKYLEDVLYLLGGIGRTP